MFQMLAGYHPFAEDCKIAVLYRIFRALGTPSHNILDCPTLLADQNFVSMMPHLPQWEAGDLAAFVISSDTNQQEEQTACELLENLLQIEPTKRGSAREHLDHALFRHLDKRAIVAQMH